MDLQQSNVSASLHQFEDAVDVCMKDKGEKIIGIDGKIYPGQKTVELLSKSGFRKDMREAISLTIDKIGQYLTSKGLYLISLSLCFFNL